MQTNQKNQHYLKIMNLRLFIITSAISLIFLLDATSALAEKHPYIKADKTTGDAKGQTQAKTAKGHSLLAGCAAPNEKNFLEFN